MHLFFCYGMRESNLGGVQVEPVSRRAIQPVAHNWRIQTVGMSRMYAQLVRTAGVRIEIYEDCSVRTPLTQTVACDSRTAVGEFHHLTRAVVRVG